jgi:TolB-like protein
MKVPESPNCTILRMKAASGSLEADNGCDAGVPSESMIREQLAHILQSPIFALSTRLSRFLRFVVESALSDGANTLKEYVIGTEVYDRRPPYHPSQDSIVRTEARRLRSKLKVYYDSEGKAAPMFIYFRTGSYVPVFRFKERTTAESPANEVIEDESSVENFCFSIAVLPFTDLSGDPLATDCARGITEELNHQLMRTEGCRVTATSLLWRSSSDVPDIPSLAQKLGVHIVFQGAVRNEDGRLRVTARLIAENGFQLWSQMFEVVSNRHSLFKITEQIASALISRTRPEEFRVQMPKGPGRGSLPHIYPAVLTAEALIDEGVMADLRSPLARFQEIVRVVPRHARAHYGIAQCHYEMALSGIAGSVDAVCRAKSATLRALELEPEMISAHSCLGSVLAMEWSWSAAEKSFEHSLSLGNDAGSFRQFALFLTALGRFDEAWHYLDRAQMIDPFSCRQKRAHAKILYLSRRYEEAVERFAGPLTHGALPPEVQLYLAFAYLQLRRLDDARELARNAQRELVLLPNLMTYVAEILAYCGDTTLADQIANHFRLLSEHSPISKVRQASLSIALGESKTSLPILAAACEEREPELLWLAVDPRFDAIRETGQFAGLKRSVRLGSIDYECLSSAAPCITPRD